MTTKEDLLTQIKILQEQVNNLPEEKPTNPLYFSPRNGEQYYYIKGSEVETDIWDDHPVDHIRADYSQLYRFKTEAEKALEQRAAILKVNRQVLDLITRDHPDWEEVWAEEGGTKYYPSYEHDTGDIGLRGTTFLQTQFTFVYAPNGVWEKISTDLIKKAMGVGGVC